MSITLKLVIMELKKKLSLLKYIKTDTDLILNGIKQNYSFFNHYISQEQKDKRNLILDFDSFRDLLEEFCYKVKYIKNKNYDIELINRLELFNEIFFSELDNVRDITVHCYQAENISDRYHLFIRLLYSIFCKIVQKNEDIELIFNNHLIKWHRALEQKKMKVKLLIPLPIISLREKNVIPIFPYSITKNISINRNVWYEYYKKANDSFSLSSPIFNNIEYKTKISFDFYRTIEERNSKFVNSNKKFRKEWNLISKTLREIKNSFYLNNIIFSYAGCYIKLPWCFVPNYEEYENLCEKLEDRPIRISKYSLEKVTNTYPKLKKSELFANERFVLLWFHYNQLFNRDYLPDVILDSFIIIEFLFGRNNPEDLTFHIAFNAGLFLTKYRTVFKKNFKFFKKSYGIRSALVHGDNWQERLREFIAKEKNINNRIDFINRLRFFINLSLQKLIESIIKIPNILEDINNLKKVENKKKKAIFLDYLGDYYKKDGNSIDCLKMYNEAYQISLQISDKTNSVKYFEKIKEIYIKNKNIIVYHEELKKFCEELDIIINLNNEKSEIAKKIKNEINKLKKITNKQEKKIKLEINGNDVMSIIGLKPSKKVGEILELIERKVKDGKLVNERNELIKYLDNIKHTRID